jgi:hypothetical protein
MAVPDLTDLEKSIIQQSINERWRNGGIVAEEVEVELRLFKGDREVTPCPAMYWEHNGCSFLVAKTGESRYRSQFFYSAKEQYNTGIEEYTDLGDCVLFLLRLQADHESERNKNFPTAS